MAQSKLAQKIVTRVHKQHNSKSMLTPVMKVDLSTHTISSCDTRFQADSHNLTANLCFHTINSYTLQGFAGKKEAIDADRLHGCPRTLKANSRSFVAGYSRHRVQQNRFSPSEKGVVKLHG